MRIDELRHTRQGLLARPRKSLLIVSILALGLASALFSFATGVHLALPAAQLLSSGLRHAAPVDALAMLDPRLMVIALSAALACFVLLRRAPRRDPIHLLKSE